MSAPVELIALVCTRCSTPVPAQPDEAAWRCEQCGQGLLFSEERGTVPLEIHFAPDLSPQKPGRPFWAARGQVTLKRQIFGRGDRSKEAGGFWQSGRTFLVPAYECPLGEVIALGMQMLERPPVLSPGVTQADRTGAAVPFQPVTLLPEDVKGYAEFIVMAVEAGRGDKLKELEFQLALDTPELWILA